MRDSRATARVNLQDVIDDCTRSLTLSDGLISELDLLQANVANALVKLDVLRAEKGVAAAKLKATQDRFSVGEVTRTDVAQAESRRAASISALETAKSNLKASRATYERVVGNPAGALMEPREPTKVFPTSLEDASE